MENLIQILRGTLNPDQNKEAEKLLLDIKKIFNFCPNLLRIAVAGDIEEPVRQAAAVTLKNNVLECWQEIDDPTVYSIHEDDKSVIRSNVMQAVLSSPNKIRTSLLEVLRVVIRNDFPGRWPTLPNEISQCIMSDDQNNWFGGYLCLLMLIKNYSFKKNTERGPLNEHMPSFLEIMNKHMEFLMNNDSEWSCGIQKTILKIFFNYTQYHLSLNVVNHKMFIYWINLLCHVTTRPLPAQLEAVDVEDRPATIWWKCKKWAMHIIFILISKYSNPASVIKNYKEFSTWFLGACTETIVRALFNVCELYSTNQYVTPRVMSYVIGNFEHMIKNASCWNYLKPHFETLLKEVLFKLLSHSSDDEKMWNEDPVEYCQTFFDMLSDPTPSYAAANLMKDVCIKRKGVLDTVMKFVTNVLDATDANCIHKDAAFHIIGHIAGVLIKKPHYSSSLESFLVNYAMPVFQAPEGFRRARTCWLVGELAEAPFQSKEVLDNIVHNLVNLISNDKELPVKVMATIALTDILVQKTEVIKSTVAPHLNTLVLQTLTLLREAEVDELNDALQNLISIFTTEMVPIAYETTNHLKNTLINLLEGELDDSKEYVILGVLSTVETLIKAMEEQPEIIGQMEVLIVSIIEVIFTKNIVEFHEEALSLAASLTVSHISPTMWQVLFFLKTILKEDPDEITEMMSLISNYLSVDKASLLEDPARINAILEIVTIVFDSDEGLDSYQAYGAKLLEILLINFKGQIDAYVTEIIKIAVNRLLKNIDFTELRTLCLQVILAALYYNAEMTLAILLSHNWPGTNNLMINEFVSKLFEDINSFMGIHDRKMYLIGMSTLLSLPAPQRPQALLEVGGKLMPELIKMMETLKNTYLKVKEEDSDYDDDNDSEDVKELGSDEDEEDNENVAYLEMLNDTEDGRPAIDLEDDDDEGSEFNEFVTELEGYETALDVKSCEMAEFIHVYNVISNLNTSDPEWYQLLVSTMTPEHNNTLKAVMEMANTAISSREKELAAAAAPTNST